MPVPCKPICSRRGVLPRAFLYSYIIMDTPEWEDDRDGASAEIRVGALRITVHRHIHLDGWLLSTVPNTIADNKSLNADTLPEAKEQALRYVHQCLSDKAEKVGKAV